MENLLYAQTQHTPQIEFNEKEKTISITGNSYPEDSFSFYQPIIQWLKEFMGNCSQNDTVKVIIFIDYMNSSSLKVYFEFFDILEEGNDKGVKIDIDWYYQIDNDIAEETGEDFALDFETLDIKLISRN